MHDKSTDKTFFVQQLKLSFSFTKH